MAITNLLLRPISSLVLYRVYNERQGRYSTFGFPGLGGLASTGPAPHGSSGRGSYENLDHTNPPHQSVPSPIRDVESQNFAQKWSTNANNQIVFFTFRGLHWKDIRRHDVYSV